MEPKNKSYLRQRRKEKGLKINELAALTYMQPTSISAMEYGKEQCGELRARRLGKFFEENWENFLTIRDEK